MPFANIAVYFKSRIFFMFYLPFLIICLQFPAQYLVKQSRGGMRNEEFYFNKILPTCFNIYQITNDKIFIFCGRSLNFKLKNIYNIFPS